MNVIKVIVAATGLVTSGPLRQDGWVRSYIEGKSVDRDGNPIPWLTYPAIDFLRVRLPSLDSVFEYGSGNGTLWWANRAASVRAVENNIDWFEKMRCVIPKNVELFYAELEDENRYVEKILMDDRTYDVILIDGRRRNACMNQSLNKTSPRGVIILDNSDRAEYLPGIQKLEAAGFRRVDFAGFCPIVNFKNQTSIFYRDGNMLGL